MPVEDNIKQNSTKTSNICRNKMLKPPYSEIIKVRGFFLLNPIGVKTLFAFTSNCKT